MPEAFELQKQPCMTTKEPPLSQLLRAPAASGMGMHSPQGEHNPIRRQKEYFSAPKIIPGRTW